MKMTTQANIVVWPLFDGYGWSVGNGMGRVEGGFERKKHRAWEQALLATRHDFGPE